MMNKFINWQKEIRMRFGYRFFGNFIANFLNRHQFDYLEDKIPNDFFDKEISDLGCGDGFATQKLMLLFRAKSITGYEINPYLVEKARKRGLNVKKFDLEKNIPHGEMALVWGVLHHLKNKEEVLKKIRSNCSYAVIREPIKSRWAFLDGGNPLKEDKWKSLFDKVLKNYQLFKFKDDLLILWKKNHSLIHNIKRKGHWYLDNGLLQ